MKLNLDPACCNTTIRWTNNTSFTPFATCRDENDALYDVTNATITAALYHKPSAYGDPVLISELVVTKVDQVVDKGKVLITYPNHAKPNLPLGEVFLYLKTTENGIEIASPVVAINVEWG